MITLKKLTNRIKWKISLMVVIYCLLPLFAYTGYAQETVVLKLNDVSLKEALKKIEAQTNYTFVYDENIISLSHKVNMNLNENSIRIILNKLLYSTNIQYVISNKKIILSPKRAEIISKNNKKRVITGKVTDAETNEPLIGVSIIIKETLEGTVTDLEGEFTLSVPQNTQLEVSYIGYKKQTINVSDLGFFNIQMKSDNEVLDEVVIVGAGTQKKVSVTGAITSIRGNILKAPTSSLTSNLAGKLSGVIAMTTTGEPGASSDFYIRGVSTFGGRATPLILLDGIEISSGDLNNLPAESIESFSILKDASATAIYGARGANGVMLVTTKSGMENSKANINVSIETSLLKPVNEVKYVDGVRWMQLYNEAQLSRNPSATPKYSSERIQFTKDGINPAVYPNVDWYDLMFKEYTFNQRANINLQGGGSKVTYYMSLQANHDTGLLDIPKTFSFDNNINQWEYTFQNNIAYKITSTTQLGLRMNAQFGTNTGPSNSTSDIFYQTYNANPVTFPAKYPSNPGDPHIKFGNAILTGSKTYINPYAYMLSTYKERHYTTLNTSLNVDQKLDFITKGLSITALINLKAYSNTAFTRTLTPYYYKAIESSWSPDDPNYYEVESVGPTGSDYIDQSQIDRWTDNTFYIDTRINYTRRFGDHSVTGMLMYMQRENRNSVLPHRNQGFSGRFTYDFQNKYLAEFNFGYNGTERLDKGNRFEFFPAVSLGWVPSNEKFWMPISKYIDYFKIRGSYGLVGSDETGSNAGAPHFLYVDQVTIGGSGGFYTGANCNTFRNGPAFGGFAVQNASWERVKKLDIGIDMNILEQIGISFDYFYDRRSRILMRRASWPIIMGYWGGTPWSNIGAVDNKGFEISINWKKELIKDLFIDLRGNFTYTQNKYVNKDEPNYPYIWQMETGKPLSTTVGYIAEGLFKSQTDIDSSPSQINLGSTVMPGDIKYRDVNCDGVINSEDQVMISPYGNTPRIQYGLGLNLTYKGFDLGLFFNGSAKRTIMISGITPFGSDAGNGDRNLMQFIADDYWSESNPNPNATYPRLGISKTQTSNNTVNSTYWMRNGNFLRFKTLELGYKFPFCRVYVSGDNLAVWSPFKLWDPELSWNSYPLQRTFNFGVQFNF